MALPKPRTCQDCPSRAHSIFCNVPPQHLTELNRSKTTNRYQRGQTLFYEGNPSTGVFCISNGKIKVFKSGADGKEVILRIVQDGDVLGCRSVLSDQEFGASAEVIEDAEVCFVDKNFIKYLVGADSDLAFQILYKLGTELGAAESRMTDLMNKPVRARMAYLLLALMKTYGKTGPGGMLLDVRLSRAELGSMVGATPETVIRLLSDFESTGYVGLEGKQIFIKNKDELLRETELDT